jgi:hypothetical protein
VLLIQYPHVRCSFNRSLNAACMPRRVPDDCTYEEAQLVRDCLQNEPDERPSAKDLVNRLAGSTTRSARMLARGSGSLTGGHISGQLLADGRCASCRLWALKPFARRENHFIIQEVHHLPEHAGCCVTCGCPCFVWHCT